MALLWSQVILAVGIPSSLVPLPWLTLRVHVMGRLVNAGWTSMAAIGVSVVIAVDGRPVDRPKAEAGYRSGVSRRRLLVVEDEPLMATLLAETLMANGFEVDCASNVKQARRSISHFDPDGILLDISLGEGPSGLDLAHVLAHQRPDIAIIFLTRHPDARTPGPDGMDVPDGCGFLRKDRIRDTEYLLSSIHAVMTDRPHEARHDLEGADVLSALSTKHIEVLRLMALGYTNEYIARAKGVAQSTAERWTVEVFRQLAIDKQADINPRVEAVRLFVASAGVPERR